MSGDFTAGYVNHDKTPLYSNSTNHREIYQFNRAYIKEHPKLLPDSNILPQFEKTFKDLEHATHKLAEGFFHCIADRTGLSEDYFEHLITSEDAAESMTYMQLAH